jgi:hypothetical protein
MNLLVETIILKYNHQNLKRAEIKISSLFLRLKLSNVLSSPSADAFGYGGHGPAVAN